MPSPQNVDVSLFYDGVWNAVEPEVFEAEQIKVTRGQGDEGAALRPAKVTLTFNNATDKYRPTNPTSPLYGKAGRNTPLQVAVDATTRTVVEATSWAPDRTLGADRATGRGRFTVDLEAYGLLGRIAQWSDDLRSPFHRHNIAAYSSTIVGYFPCEDPRGATTLFAPVPGSSVRLVTNVETGTQYRFAGSEPLMSLSSDAVVAVAFAPTGLTNSGFQVSWTSQHDQIFAAGLTGLFQFDGSDGTHYEVSYFNGTDLFMTVTAIDGTALVSNNVSFGSTLDYTKWNMFRCRVTASGGTVSVELSWIQEGSGTFYGFTWTYAGTTGALRYAAVSTGHTAAPGLKRYGHILGLSTGADDLESNARVEAFNGHPGELAATRFLRLMGELGLAAVLLGVEAGTWPMGVQRSDTFLNLLQEIARTEDALIFDTHDAIGLTMRTRRHRYNQTPALALTFGSNVAVPFNEILDDLDTHNRVTVSQRDGGDYEAVLTTGRMSVQPPPAGVGEYRQRVDVNVANETTDLPVLAGWWLNRGTLERSRYSSVTVDLVANPSLAAACNALEIGDLITVAGYEADPIPLIAIGLLDVPGNNTRKVTFTTVPADLFLTGVYDDTVKRFDVRGSLTVGTMSTTFGTVTATQPNDKWGSSTPYDILVAGERMTVNSVFNSGANKGLNVTRSVNGVVKTHAAGEEVHIANQGRYGL